MFIRDFPMILDKISFPKKVFSYDLSKNSQVILNNELMRKNRGDQLKVLTIGAEIRT